MRVSREQAAESRERILAAASRLFREHGYGGIGVADLMKTAGLTHGGFYSHFASKDELMAEATARALSGSAARWNRLADEEGEAALRTIAAYYLSPEHRRRAGSGCAVPSLAAEASRQGGAVRVAFTKGLAGLVDALGRVVPGRTRAARRKRALASFAAMAGAVVLARAVDDDALAEEILDAVKDAVTRAG
jgi:TetR/AcrR family transcriptional repressor of nem operon